MNLVFTEEEYARDGHIEQYNLEEKLCKLYNVNNCRVIPSGLTAITAVFNAFQKSKKQPIIIHSNEIYDDCYRIFNYLNIDSIAINVDDHEQIFSEMKKYKDRNILFYIESCSNPSGKVFDFNTITKLRDIVENLIIFVDNTWLSHKIFNPFNWDVDIVAISLTKYYSGGKSLCGALLTKSCSLFINIEDWIVINGLYISPYNCRVCLDNLDTMNLRVKQASNNTELIIKFLNEHGVHIYHPFVNNNKFAIQNFTLCPPIVTFIINKTKDEITKIINKTKNINFKTSYGGLDTRIKICESDISSKCRLSIGYDNNIETVIEILEYLI